MESLTQECGFKFYCPTLTDCMDVKSENSIHIRWKCAFFTTGLLVRVFKSSDKPE